MPVTRRMAMPNTHNFSTCYIDMCRQQNRRPLPVICVSLPHSLDFTTDHVKLDDWGPILNSLSLDRALNSIGIRSRYQSRKPIEEKSENKKRNVAKAPVVFTRSMLEWLSHSIAQCVRNSSTLVFLELEGIPLPLDCLTVLCVGLSSTTSLRHLSLRRCYIGDNGCDMICRTVTHAQSIKSLNLSQCDLSSSCGISLASALSRQKLSLYHDTWMQSLRYRQPDLEAMPGLRRLTLNGNPQLGDSVVSKLIDAVGDSLWLKALDLQNCGLTDAAALEILQLLERNTTLVVVDVRINPNLKENLVEEIVRKLDRNNSNDKSEYRWLGLPRNKVSGAVSAHCMTKPRTEEVNKVMRPKSAFVQQSKRFVSRPITTRRTPSTPVVVTTKRTKIQSQPPKDLPIKITKSEIPKKSLHIDLQSHILSTVDVADSTEEHIEKETMTDEVINETDVLLKLAHLSTQYDKLLEYTRRTDHLLREERSRREMAEAKIHSMSHNLMELEDALKEKERETHGYLLVDQKFLDEIYVSFNQLLEMLDDLTRNPRASKIESEEDFNAREDIKKRVTLLIRKTKSENLKRGYFPDSSKKDTFKKLAKSESNIRDSDKCASVRLERNIGDNPDINSQLVENTFEESSKKDIAKTPMELARAIFTLIVNGGAVSSPDFFHNDE